MAQNECFGFCELRRKTLDSAGIFEGFGVQLLTFGAGPWLYRVKFQQVDAPTINPIGEI